MIYYCGDCVNFIYFYDNNMKFHILKYAGKSEFRGSYKYNSFCKEFNYLQFYQNWSYKYIKRIL